MLSLQLLEQWLSHPITQVLYKVCDSRRLEASYALEHMNFRRSSDEVALNTAELSGALKVYRVLQDRELLKSIFKDYIDWEEEIDRDGKTDIVQFNGSF